MNLDAPPIQEPCAAGGKERLRTPPRWIKWFNDLRAALNLTYVTIPSTFTTATATLGSNDTRVIVNFAGVVTLTLPSPSTVPARSITIKTITANAVNSASANVVPLVGGAAGVAILAGVAGKWATLVSDGTNWIIMAGN